MGDIALGEIGGRCADSVWQSFIADFSTTGTFGDSLPNITVSGSGLDSATTARLLGHLVNDSNLARYVTASTYTGSGGSGAYTDTVYAVDTSGTDARTGSVDITIRTQTGVLVDKLTTDANGRTFWHLDASTYYRVAAQATGYTWAVNDSFLTGSGTGGTDSTLGYNIDIDSPTNASLKRVYGYEYSVAGDSVSNIWVEFVLVPNPDSASIHPADTSNNVQLAYRRVVTDSSAASGRWQVDIVPTNYIRPFGSTYTVTIRDGMRVIAVHRLVTPEGTATECLRQVLGQGDCP